MRVKITLCVLIINLLVAAMIGAIATRALQDNSNARVRTSMLDQVRLISCAVGEPEASGELLSKIAIGNDAAIQLIDRGGEVVFDSRPKKSTPDIDPDAEPEVVNAFLGEAGYSTRMDGTVLKAYAATQTDSGVVLRLIKPLTSVQRELGAQIRNVWLWLLLVIPVILLLCWLLTLQLKRVSELLTGAIRKFGQGDYSVRIPAVASEKEVMLAEFNTMAEQVERRCSDMKKRNHAMNMITSTMQNGILAINSDMRVILINPAAKQMLGIVGQAEGMVISEASKDVNVKDVLCSAMGQEGVYTCDIAARTAVGRSRRPLRLYASALREGDATVGALALVEDVTELRRLEQVRTDFVANVSHELKTPLTSIKGFVETLQAGAINKPEMAQKFLNIIMLEADRLTRLINDILSLSKLESGNDKVEMEKLQLNVMASDVCDLLRMHAKQKNITVNCNESAPSAPIWGNPDRVRQLLINLIDNAIKYNLEGGSVTVAVYKDAVSAYLSVSDTGIGIPEEHIPRLFERFYRVDKGRSRSMGGTGLGLAIVKHIVQSMDGHIEVHSKLNEGTEFLITIPLYSGQKNDKGSGVSMDDMPGTLSDGDSDFDAPDNGADSGDA